MDQKIRQSAIKFNLKAMLLAEGWFDKSLTFISGGAMLLSISFIDKMVPFKDALCLWILILSWVALILSLILNLLAHRKASLNAMITVRELEEEKDDKEAFAQSQKRNIKMNHLTLASVWCMGIGLFCLITYSSINLYNMPDEKKITQNPGDGTKSVPSHVPAPATPIPVAPATPQPSPNPPKKP